MKLQAEIGHYKQNGRFHAHPEQKRRDMANFVASVLADMANPRPKDYVPEGFKRKHITPDIQERPFDRAERGRIFQ